MTNLRSKNLGNIETFLLDFGQYVRRDMFNVFSQVEGKKGYLHRSTALTDEVIRRHARDEQPVAVFLLEGDMLRSAALDLDSHDGELDWATMIEKARPIMEALQAQGLKPMAFRSGGGAGLHLWMFWGEQQPARRVRRKLAAILRRLGFELGTGGVQIGQVEVFPKQDSLPDGKVGSPIALPLARASLALDSNLEPIPLDQFEAPDFADWMSKPFDQEPIEPNPEPTRPKGPPSARRGWTNDRADVEDARSALNLIPADDRGLWVDIGHALKNAFGEDGFDIWRDWSRKSAKYSTDDETYVQWVGFDPRGEIGLGTIFHLAKQAGWNRPPGSVIREMNRQYGILAQGKRTQIIVKKPDPRSHEVIEFLSRETLKDRLGGRTVQIDGKPRPLADYWLSDREASRFARLDFDPGQPPGDNGNTWNTWTGFAIEPRPGDWSLLNAHIRDNIAGGNEELHAWLLNWMALGVQQPGLVIGTVPTLKGLPGTGKGVLAHAYGSLWGRHYTSITQEAHVKGRFTAHLLGRRFVFIDEGIFGGDRRDAGVLKTRITEPILTFEQKGVDAIRVENHSIYMVASNEDAVVPADLADRRWQVIEVSDRRREDQAYFGAIARQLATGGREGMLHDLLQRDLSQGTDPRRTIKTDALFEQVIRAGGPMLRYLYELLDEGVLPQPHAPGNGPGRTTIEAMHEELRTRHPGGRFIGVPELGKFIKRAIPSIDKTQSGMYLPPGASREGGRRSMRYVFPDLPLARRQFEAYVRQRVRWTNDLREWQGQTPSPRGSDSEVPF